MNTLSDLELYSALIATGVPWVAALINRQTASSTAKWAVFAAICVVAALGTTFLEGNLHLTGEGFIRSLLVIVTLAGVYFHLWRPAVKEVEQATS